MRRGWAAAVAGLAIFGLAGCYGYEYADTKSMQPGGTAFDKALFKEYVAESKSEFEQGNYQSSDRWAKTAQVAAKGQTPKPTQVSDWNLPSSAAPEITTARTRLQAALDKGGAQAAPTEMAKAQVGWDCWCEQQRVEENFQPADIANCRQRFYDNIAKVEAALTPKPAPAPAPKAEAPKDFLVFFDWDKSVITPEARRILTDVVAQAKAKNVKSLKVVGFTDTSGSAQWNLALSVRRAEAVKVELVRLGFTGSITTEGRGETDLLVPTPDGVREPQNRRAQITPVTAGASLKPADGKTYVQFDTIN